MRKPGLELFSIAATIAFILSATSVFAEEGPSKEDTIAWLYEKIAVIEIPEFDLPHDDDYKYRRKKMRYHIDFTEDGTTIKIYHHMLS